MPGYDSSIYFRDREYIKKSQDHTIIIVQHLKYE